MDLGKEKGYEAEEAMFHDHGNTWLGWLWCAGCGCAKLLFPRRKNRTGIYYFDSELTLWQSQQQQQPQQPQPQPQPHSYQVN